MSRPPRLAHRLLAARLARDERDELIGDLDEQFLTRAAADGEPAARRWYWRQTLALLWGFALHRRDLISTAHERTRGRWAFDNARADWRHAWRSLRHARSFALVALLTLTCGIGLSTVVFSMVNGILLQPLPVPDSHRIVRLGEQDTAQGNRFDGMINVGEQRTTTLRDVSAGVWIGTHGTIAAFAPIQTTETTVRTPTEPLRLRIADVGPQFFEVYRLRPVLGRLLHPSDDQADAPRVVLVTDRFWAQRLGRRGDVLDLALTIDQHPARIVGVVPTTLDFLEPQIDLFQPGRFTYPDPGRQRMFSMNMNMTALLAPGATVSDARAEGQRILTSIATANPAFFDGTVPVPQVRVDRLDEEIIGPVRPALTMLLVGMVCVLAAMCANLASLLLSRNTARRQEVAMRLALGASRWRIVRPLLFEQLSLSVVGGVAGGALAWVALRLLPHFAPADLPRLSEVRFDLASLGFAAGAAIVTAVAVGLLPAWQIPTRHIREFTAAPRAAGGTGLRSLLAALQVAMATVLLVGAGLIGRSLLTIVRIDPGYRPDNVFTFQIATPDRISRQQGRLHTFYRTLTERLSAYPGVVAAGVSSALPLHVGGSAGTYTIEGRPVPPPDERPRAQSLGITQGYQHAMGLRLVSGRFFDERDTPTSEPVCLVNDVFAQRYFPGEDPIGHRLSVRVRAAAQIVGVVASSRIGPLTRAAPPSVLQLAIQQPESLGYGHVAGGVAVRTAGDPAAVMGAVRNVVREIEPDWPVYNVERLDDRLGRTFAQPRFYSITLALFAVLSVATAMLGLYGVLSYSVERRRVEFGVRRALGAGEGQIVVLATRRAAGLAGAGLLLGLGIAAAAAALLRAALFGVHPLDPAAYTSATALVILVVIAASWIPARRALQIDPARALRVE